MDINEKIVEAKKQLENCVRNNSFIEKDYEEVRGKLNEEAIIKLYLAAGVSPMVLEQKFCEYFWATFFKQKYMSKEFLKLAEERARVAPLDMGMVSIEYIRSRILYWQNECLAIEKMLMSNNLDKELTEDEKIKISNRILENTKSKDKKVIAKCNAIDRYSELTKLNQMKENFQKRNPKKINFDSMNVEEIDKLYAGKKR